MPAVVVTTCGVKVSAVKSLTEPTSSNAMWLVFSKSGPSAKPSAGSANIAEATPPAVRATPVMNERRVTVSPSNAPGQPRSAVNFDFGGLAASAGVVFDGVV